MALLQAKQIEKVISAFVGVANFSTTASSSDVVTTALTTALATASNDGGSVPVQVSGDNFTQGIITAPATNRVEIEDNATKEKIVDNNGNEVYGRITESTGIYTLSYFVNDGGTETAYSFASATDIDFRFAYRFSFDNLPADAILLNKTVVADDPAGGGGKITYEVLTPTGLNTLPNLSNTPVSGTNVILYVNGKSEDDLAGGAISVTGIAVTWSSVNAGYDVETTDRVIAQYTTAS